MQKSIRFGDLAARIQRQADLEDRSFSYVVLRAVREWLDEYEEPSEESKAQVSAIVGDKQGVEALTVLQEESNRLHAARREAASLVLESVAVPSCPECSGEFVPVDGRWVCRDCGFAR